MWNCYIVHRKYWVFVTRSILEHVSVDDVCVFTIVPLMVTFIL